MLVGLTECECERFVNESEHNKSKVPPSFTSGRLERKSGDIVKKEKEENSVTKVCMKDVYVLLRGF